MPAPQHMTQAQIDFRKKLIKKIHCAPIYKDIYKDDRNAYEDLLFNHFGVRSSTVLSIDDLLALSRFFWGRGRLPALRAVQNAKCKMQKGGSADNIVDLPTAKQRHKIGKLIESITWRAEDGYLKWLEKRMGMKSVRTKADATKVITALEKMAALEESGRGVETIYD